MTDSIASMRRAFTLIELLLAIAIVSALLVGTAAKLKPLERLGIADNLRRSSDIRQLRMALMQAQIDRMELPSNIPYSREEAKWICQYSYRGLTCIDPPIQGVDLSSLVPTYLSAIPEDPRRAGNGVTGYRIYSDGALFFIEAVFTEP